MPRIQNGDLDFNNAARQYNLPAPSTPNEPARLADLQNAIEGLNWKDNVRVSTQGNINLASPGAAIDTVTMALNDRFAVRFQTAAAENGVYIWNGAAVAATRASDANSPAELRNAVVTVDEGTSAGTTWRVATLPATLGTDPVNWSPFNPGAAPATTTTTGTVTLATQAEVNTGTDASKAVTPATLAAYSGRKFLFSAVIGDGTATQIDVTHNFNTRNLDITVFLNSGEYDDYDCERRRPTVNTCRLKFATPPAANSLVVVVTG